MKECGAIVLDLDGVVNWRIPAQKAGIPLFGQPSIHLEPVAIRPVQKEVLDRRISARVIYDAIRHSLTPVFPDVIRVIKELDGKFIFGNTGWHNNEPMIAATVWSLTWAGIFSRFDDIYFRPAGYKTVESKVASIADIRRQFDDHEICVADDNPLDLIPEAITFPNIRFLLISDLTTGRLTNGIDFSTLPNVHRVSTLRAGLLMERESFHS